MNVIDLEMLKLLPDHEVQEVILQKCNSHDFFVSMLSYPTDGNILQHLCMTTRIINVLSVIEYIIVRMPHLISEVNHNGLSAVHYACVNRSGNDIISLLVRYNKDCLNVNPSPLYVACVYSNYRSMRLLIRLGCTLTSDCIAVLHRSLMSKQDILDIMSYAGYSFSDVTSMLYTKIAHPKCNTVFQDSNSTGQLVSYDHHIDARL